MKTNLDKLIENVEQWANSKQLTDPYKQAQQLDEERAELMDAIKDGFITDIKDELGDNFVVPIVIANCYEDINLLECHRYSAYMMIEPQKYDADWMYRHLQATSQSILDVAYYGQIIDLKYNLGKYVTLVRIICGRYHTSFEECLARAYKKISKRSGKNVDGKFIKDKEI